MLIWSVAEHPALASLYGLEVIPRIGLGQNSTGVANRYKTDCSDQCHTRSRGFYSARKESDDD